METSTRDEIVNRAKELIQKDAEEDEDEDEEEEEEVATQGAEA